ncbi:MAG TPA: hypothetical protein PLP30_08255 [Clostridia bacterium]|nr:hypothetical protein [Clostridia bacterium]
MSDYSLIYEKLYKLFDNTTPMHFDCGLLCSHSCCRDNGSGMYLFPHEEEYLESLGHDFTITESNFIFNYSFVKLLVCNGYCNRGIRPLSCRIFPLFPYLRNGRISVDFDPRAKGMCPLLFTDIDELYILGLFRLKVFKAGTIVSDITELANFLENYSAELDTIARFKL